LSRVVFDTGALVGLERNDRSLWAVLKSAALSSSHVYVPSAALAQVWRGSRGQARLASALQHCVVASFDSITRSIGELCGRTKTVDVCDATLEQRRNPVE
jgi:hypothetical protein